MTVPFSDIKLVPDILVFDGPFSYAHCKRVQVYNDSWHKVCWKMKKRCGNQIILDPHFGVLKDNESMFIDVTCNAFDKSEEMCQDDVLIFEWVEVPSDSGDVFDLDEFRKHNDILRRKNLHIVYHEPELHTPSSLYVEPMEKGEDDNKDNADDDDDEEQQLHKTMVRLKNPSKDRQMYWIAKTNCESRTVEPPYGFLNGNDSGSFYVTFDPNKCDHQNRECEHIAVQWTEVPEDAPKIFSPELYEAVGSISRQKDVVIHSL